MKRTIFFISTGILLSLNSSFAQDVHHSQVPSIILNHFNKNFPKAKDIDWEKEGDMYNVDFETGWSTDHEVWYNPAGEMVKHRKEISKSDLPKSIRTKVNSEFSGFIFRDVEKTVSESDTTYSMELHSFTQEWEVIFDAKGELLSKKTN